MKNIILLGVPRAGKTSLAKMLRDEYQVICGDSIRNAYKTVFLSNKEMSSGDVGRTHEFRKFLKEVFRNYIRYNSEVNYILDTVDFNLENSEFIETYNICIIVLGYTRLTPLEVVSAQKKFDKKDKDWSYFLTDEKRLEKAKTWIHKSIDLKKECESLGIMFVDTSIDRDKVLKDLSIKIKNM